MSIVACYTNNYTATKSRPIIYIIPLSKSPESICNSIYATTSVRITYILYISAITFTLLPFTFTQGTCVAFFGIIVSYCLYIVIGCPINGLVWLCDFQFN